MKVKTFVSREEFSNRRQKKEAHFTSSWRMDKNLLPIRRYENEIVRAVKENPVVVILGETGSGKTTQIAQIVYEHIDEILSTEQQQQKQDEDEDDDENGNENWNERWKREEGHRRRRLKRRLSGIAVTQPRRVAAISVARRVHEEMCEKNERKNKKKNNENPKNEEEESRKNTKKRFGQGVVGYSVRFDDNTSKNTKIKYLTDGMLLREVLSDPELQRYGVVVLDEAHERSVNTDVLFGILKKLTSNNSNNNNKNGLKVVVTSATLDSEKFSAYFNNCPVFNVPGRAFPVKISHALERPPTVSNNGKSSIAYFDAAIDTVLQIHESAKIPGDILCFLTGKSEIDRACKILDERVKEMDSESMRGKLAQIIPLYAALTPEMQARVFSKKPESLESTCRRIVIATNIAETSLTVPGIVYVVDPGVVKLKRYDAATGIETLDVEQISKVQATQRAGRAGRTQAGKCYRLYTKENFQLDFADATEPEIQRTSLVNVVLYLKSLELEDMDVLRFDFLDRPKESALKDALKQLYVLDAIDENGKITKIGKEMSPLPLEPNLARAMLEAKKLGCVEECATIAAMLSVDRLEVADSSSHSKSREYRGNPLQKIVSEDAFALGDHIVFLRTFERWQRERYRRDFAREYSLSERGLEFAKDVRRQLLDSLRSLEDDNDVGLSKRSRGKEEKREEEEEEQQRHSKNKSERSRTKNVRKALAKGFISKIARRGTASNCFKTFAFETKTLTEVHPSCARALADEDGLLPDWIVYHEMVMTSRPFLRHVCKVEYEWIEDALPRLESPIDVKKLSGGFYENERDFSSGGGPENGDTAANATNAQEDKTQQKVKQEEKVNEARARFLARKKMKAGAK